MSLPAGAQSLLNNGRPPAPGPEPVRPRVERSTLPRGTHFETGPGALATTIDSDRVVELWMHPTPRSIQMFFSPVGSDGSSAGIPHTAIGPASAGPVVTTHRLTISGLTPQVAYYLYTDDLNHLEVITPDADGKHAFDLELAHPRLVILQANPSTFHLWANGSGCGLIGTFDAATLTCTLNRDVRQSIEIEDDGMTLDGAGFTLDGTGPLFGAAGVFVRQRRNVTVRNVVIDRADTGVTVSGSSDCLFENITIQNGVGGFLELFESPGADTGRNTFRNNEVSMACPPGIPCGFGLQGIFNNESKVLDNRFVDTKFGVASLFSVKMRVEGNTMEDNPTGISVTSSLSDVDVLDNDITGSSVGIVIGTAINCSIAGNFVDGSTEVGLRLPSLGCEVTGNTFANGTLGLDLSGPQNSLFHNRFVNNATQVVLGPNANDNSFTGVSPIGGNFWSDFDEAAEGCNDTNADGFCDDPYVLTLGADLQPWAADSGWLDGIPPETIATYAGTAGNAGWYRSDVSATLAAEDNPGGTGVLLTEFSTGGAFASGLSHTITGNGSQPFSFRSTDRAGNVETTQDVIIRIDQLAPEVMPSRIGPPNAAGWNNHDALVDWVCIDVPSGIETCPDGVLVSDETGGQEVTGTATDVAGNSTSVTVTVKLDKTPPEIVGTPSATANAAGWHNEALSVHFTCTDALSGIASCPDDQPFGEGTDQAADGTALDVAGNDARAFVTPIRIDLTDPTIQASVAPPPNAAGWHNEDATVSFVCGDALSGIADCPSSESVTSEGAAQPITGTATDVAGNTNSATALVSLDRTPPSISVQLDPPANAAGWNNSAVTVQYTCSDALSGVASCPGGLVLDTEGADQQGGASAFDAADNNDSVTVQVSIDRTAPAVGFSGGCGGTAFLNQAFSTTVLVGDALSGVAAQSIQNGTLALPTDTVGAKSVTLIAADLAGNQASTTCDYTVLYDFLGGGGFNAPVDMPPVLNVARAGSTIPVKWRLPDGLGGYLSSLAIVESIQAQEVSCSDFDDTLTDPIDTIDSGDSGLRFDPEANQFIYNWKSTSTMTGKCFLLQLNLDDDQTYEAHVKFRN